MILSFRSQDYIFQVSGPTPVPSAGATGQAASLGKGKRQSLRLLEVRGWRKDKDFYTGFTKNLKLRFEQHNNGLVESTKERRPFDLIYYEECLDPDDAARRERYLKTYHGKMFLRRRLKSYLTG